MRRERGAERRGRADSLHDAGSSQAVRGYLLPRQLQQVTVEEQANNLVSVAPEPAAAYERQ